jgi:hypothetical protein
MDTNQIIAFLFGSSFKIVDEMIDNPQHYTDSLQVFTKIFTLLFYIFYSYNDFLLVVYTLIAAIASYSVGCVDDPYWEYFFSLVAILFLIYGFQSEFQLNNIPFHLFFMIPFVFVILLEACIHPEDRGKNKTRTTIILLIGLFMSYWIISSIEPALGIEIQELGFYKTHIFFIIGYFLTRLVASWRN